MALSYELGIMFLFLAGITNVVFMLLILLSCRCMGSPLTKGLFGSRSFQKFYSKHCYFWWLFIASVAVHTALAFYLFGQA